MHQEKATCGRPRRASLPHPQSRPSPGPHRKPPQPVFPLFFTHKPRPKIPSTDSPTVRGRPPGISPILCDLWYLAQEFPRMTLRSNRSSSSATDLDDNHLFPNYLQAKWPSGKFLTLTNGGIFILNYLEYCTDSSTTGKMVSIYVFPLTKNCNRWDYSFARHPLLSVCRLCSVFPRLGFRLRDQRGFSRHESLVEQRERRRASRSAVDACLSAQRHYFVHGSGGSGAHCGQQDPDLCLSERIGELRG